MAGWPFPFSFAGMKSPEALLAEGISALGMRPSRQQLSAFMSYLSELKKWNRAHSLTSLKTDREIVVSHFLDSLLFLKVLPDSAASVADVGSGAGFPGIPMKIMRPSLKMVLIEPTKKKAVFLRHICHLLGLQEIEIIDKRLEEVKNIRADAAVTRALFRAAEFAEKAKHILEPAGLLILSKGPSAKTELEEMELSEIDVREIDLPYAGMKRALIILRPY